MLQTWVNKRTELNASKLFLFSFYIRNVNRAEVLCSGKNVYQLMFERVKEGGITRPNHEGK